MSVALYSDQNSLPGVEIETFSFFNAMGPFGKDHPLLAADSILRPTLTPATSYWIVGAAPDVSTYAAWYINNGPDVGLVATQIQRDDFGNIVLPFCCARIDLRNAFEVSGTPLAQASTPEPSSMVLLATRLVLIATSSRRSALFARTGIARR